MNIFIVQIPYEYDQMLVTNIIQIKHRSEESQLVGDWPVGYLQGVEDLNSGPPKTNSSVASKRIGTQDLWITSPAQYH